MAEGFFTLDTLFPQFLLEAPIKLCLELQRAAPLQCTQEIVSHLEQCSAKNSHMSWDGQAHCHGAFAASRFYFCGCLQCSISWRCLSTCKQECAHVYVYGNCTGIMVVLKIYNSHIQIQISFLICIV